MISEAERNYEPRSWVEIDDLPEIVRPLGQALSFYICNSESMRFDQLVRDGIGHKAVLLDYELVSLDLDPLCGSSLQTTADEKFILTVFAKDGNRTFLEV